MKILPPSNQQEDILVDISITPNENVSEEAIEKTVKLHSRTTEVLFEPAVLTRYIKLQTVQNKAFGLCEVEVYGTGKK